jgi:hypothetical protein
MKTCLFLFLSISLPLLAQNSPSPDASAATNNAVLTLPAPPRNIMPLSINHKPNAVNPPPEIAGPIDKFFKGLATGEYADTYETFLAGSRLGLQKERMSGFISKTEEAIGIYGKLEDYEIFDNYSIGSNVLVVTYLSRHQEQPLRWRFIYYRAQKNWKLIQMGLDDGLLDTLD